jgi:hypothetical protein
MVPMCGRGNWNCFFFFLTSFWGEPSEKGIGRTTFFLITFSYSIYTTPLVIFAFKFQCTSSLCIPEKEQKKWPSMTDVKLRKMLFFIFVCVCCVPLQRNSFRALVTHNTRPYNRLFCDSSFVHLFFWAHTIKTFLLLSIWTLWTSQWIAMVCLFLSYFFGYICQPRSFSLSVYRPFFTI